MWGFLKGVLGRSDSLNDVLGGVVFETPPAFGEKPWSLSQWRLKRSLDGKTLFLSLKLKPDFPASFEGMEVGYISFTITTAEQIRESLDLCIAEHRRLSAMTSPGEVSA